MAMSLITTSGMNVGKISSAAATELSERTSQPKRSSKRQSRCAADWLSSTTRIRRGFWELDWSRLLSRWLEFTRGYCPVAAGSIGCYRHLTAVHDFNLPNG